LTAGIASFRFSVRWARAGKVVLRPLAVLTGFPVRPKLDWLFAKMALGTCNDPELCGVFPPGKKRQEESQIGHERRSHHRAFYPGLPLRDSGVSNLPGIGRTQRIAGMPLAQERNKFSGASRTITGASRSATILQPRITQFSIRDARSPNLSLRFSDPADDSVLGHCD
jgi:hypothetical protein